MGFKFICAQAIQVYFNECLRLAYERLSLVNRKGTRQAIINDYMYVTNRNYLSSYAVELVEA